MKKLISIILAALILFSCFGISAAAAPAATIEQTIRALGIMVGDQYGNMNLSSYVTRAQFAKMLIMASPYKDTIGQSGKVSPFKDVKYIHWSAEYVKTAVDAGWIVGYLDGTFRPENTITLEEAASCILKLLGYTASDLTGTYPNAQIAKFRALGLADGLALVQGQRLTRYDCMNIFYNLMGASTKDGKVYGTLLGYTVNAAGEVEYTSVVLGTMKGPFVVENNNWSLSLPFALPNAIIYRNDLTCSAGDIAVYDVWYYNENTRTVYAYSKKATGTYTAVLPSAASPATVTVSGVSYAIGSSTASIKLSAAGEFKTGDSVTLLLGMDGKIVDVISPTKLSDLAYGVVVGSGTITYTDAGGKNITENTVKVACTDGVEREFSVGSAKYDAGSVVSAGYSDGKIAVKWMARSAVTGRVNDAATELGSYMFADQVEILDISSEGGYVKIPASRLAGATLNGDWVLFYTQNSAGRINRLILNSATGDISSYGILTATQKIETASSTSGAYSLLVNGSASNANTSGYIKTSVGPVEVVYKNGQLYNMLALESIQFSAVGQGSASSGNKQYLLADNVQVYEKRNDSYTQVTLDSVSNLSKYYLTGYFDTSARPAGGRVRVIVAVAK